MKNAIREYLTSHFDYIEKVSAIKKVKSEIGDKAEISDIIKILNEIYGD